jgi:hypothetical protein
LLFSGFHHSAKSGNWSGFISSLRCKQYAQLAPYIPLAVRQRQLVFASGLGRGENAVEVINQFLVAVVDDVVGGDESFLIQKKGL